MKKITFILLFEFACVITLQAQRFSTKDFFNVAKMASKDVSRFMFKKRFIVYHDNHGVDSVPLSFIPKVKGWKSDDVPKCRVDIFQKDDSRYLIWRTTSFDEFLEAQEALVKGKFNYDKTKNINKDSSILFQKNNLSVLTNKKVEDSITYYSFQLKEKKIPDSIAFADELLQFDSNEYLESYFGEKNVKKDLYYFSENELRKCSVLFGNTPYQAMFVWGDETNLDKLSYIIISNIFPTKTYQENGIPNTNNDWKFVNGIRSGMSLRDVLRLNEMDFTIYGNKSDLGFMVKPTESGKIDFKKMGLLFRCPNCFDNEIFNQKEISALDLAKANLPLKVFDIIIYP